MLDNYDGAAGKSCQGMSLKARESGINSVLFNILTFNMLANK